MSTTSGLSSNASNSKLANPLKLDNATRESLQAQSEARIIAGMLGGRSDSFNSGGGLNPLKGLYSAAAASFLKNKQDRMSTAQSEQKKSSFESSISAVRKLETQSASSSDSRQQSNAKVSGPASGANYKKYEWTGKPGPTGSDKLEEDMKVESQDDASAGDINKVFASLSQVITDNGGEVNDQGDGVSSFSVMDLASGSLTLDGDTIQGLVKTNSGVYSFSVDKEGAASIDASQGDTSSAEYEQLKGLINGSLDGARRSSGAVVEPEEAEPAAVKAADQAAADQAAAEAAAAAKAAAARAAADAAAAAAASADTGNYADSNELMNAFLKAIDSAGGSSVNSNGDETTRVTFRGMTGDVEEKDGEIRGQLSFGTGSVEFRVTLNGDVTRFKTSGITLLNTSSLSALKSVLGSLDRDSVNVVA